MPNRIAARAIISMGILAAVPLCARAEGGAGAARGPVVVVPECRMVQSGCGLDPASPDLNGAACATAVAKQLGRRGFRTTLPGPVADVCAVDPNAVVAVTKVTAECHDERDGRTPRRFATKTRLVADLEIRNCATGVSAGQAHTARAIESGRRALIRDLIEELGHHLSPRRVRKSHPETPLRWMGADVGGERSVEVDSGAIDTSRSGINRILRSMGLPEQERARRLLVESAYTPWSAPHLRFAMGITTTEMHSSGSGTFNGSLLNLPPSKPQTFTDVPVDVTIRTVGVNFSASYGIDYLRHQRISAGVNVGYSVMGGSLAQSRIDIDAPSPIATPLLEAAWPIGAAVRWEWRIFPHWALAVTYGWNEMIFRNPREVYTDRFAPYDVGYTGAEARVGIAVRY